MRPICSMHRAISQVLIDYSNQHITLWLSQDSDYTYSVLYAFINSSKHMSSTCVNISSSCRWLGLMMSRFEWNRKFFGSAELVARHRAADPACTNAFDGGLPCQFVNASKSLSCHLAVFRRVQSLKKDDLFSHSAD